MADRYLRASGNWTDAVWAATSSGTAGSAATPTSSDIIHIQAGYTVTLSEDASISSAWLLDGRLNLAGYKLTILGDGSSAGTFYQASTGNTILDMTDGILEMSGADGYPTSFQFTTADTNHKIISDNAQLIFNAGGTFQTSLLELGGNVMNDVVVNLGTNGLTNGGSSTLDITGSPTFRSLIIQSKNSAAHTVNFDGSGATITVDKFVAVGSSSSNKLSLDSTNAGTFIEFTENATCYGQYVSINDSNISPSMPSGANTPLYIGSNSTSELWLTQDPPKISTLVDPLTTAPGSNTNWTVSGTVTQVTTGHYGGGYKIGDDQSGTVDSITSTDTYDLVDSELIAELLPGTGNLYISIIDALSQYMALIAADSSFMLFDWGTPYNSSSTYTPNGVFGFVSFKLNSDGTVTAKYSTDGSSWITLDMSGIVYSEDAVLASRSIRLSASAGGIGGHNYLGSINPSFNQSPTTTLTSPADNTTLTTTTPTLTMKATDPEGEAVTYQVQISTDNTFATTLIDALSATDLGFSGTDPYTSAASVSYTVQTALTKGGIDYYWRVRAKDPSGSNSWGAWSEIRKMTTEALPPTITSSTADTVKAYSAKVYGNVTSDGGANISGRGFVYGLTANPTTSGNIQSASGTTGSYNATLSGLTDGTQYHWRAYAINSKGTSYSTDRTFTTLTVTAPTVTTTAASNVTKTSASSGGNVTSANNGTISERGIVWSTSSNPTTSDNKIKDSGATTGSYSANIIGLTSNTTYHVRAYAINEKGTAYGSDVSFTTLPKAPTVTTGTPGTPTLTSVAITDNALASNPDNQTISEYGVAYSTTQNPTVADSTKTALSSPFDVTLSSLSQNTTYYARAYVKWGANSDVVYGSQVSFKTQGKATVTLDSPATFDSTTPQLKFTGTDPDNDNITYELQLNSSNSFTTPLIDKLSATDSGFANLTTTKTDPFYSGNQIGYTLSTDLTRGTSYYWRVRGKDVTGSNTWGNWSAVAKFTVSAVLASLTTNGASNITFNTADVAATVNSDGGAAITERGVVYSTSANPTIANSKVTDAGTGATFTASLTGLTASTTYYARAYAINSVGTAYGNSITFQTAQTPAAPTVVTGSPAATTDITSQFNGNEVTLDGTQTVTERGIVFSDTNTTPTTDDRTITAPTAGLGTYDLKMTGLDASTTYYVRAYAVNSIGTGYGDVVSFTTQAPFTPDEGDGYWTWAPGQSQATVGRTQATQAYSSVDLNLEDLSLTNGEQYTLYYAGADSDSGTTAMTLQRYDGTTKIEDTITPGTPYTFTYDTTLIHWSIRLFVTGSTDVADPITAVFNDLYLAQEGTFSGFVPFTPRGVTELKLINNQLIDDRREDVISSIFDQVNGVSWYPFNIDTEGLGWFEIGDRFTITDDAGDSKSVVVWNTKLTIDGGISENLYTNKPDLTETDYTKAGNSKLRGNLRNTTLQVDKQQGTIDALVSDMYNYDGVVNTKYTELLQNNESIIATVQGAGGVNLLKNSVMYAFDDSGNPDKWTMTGSGSFTIQASPESLAAGAVSGNAFTLSDMTATQTVTVRKDVDFITEDEKTYYSISARVKKNTVGTASITLTNRNETLTIDLPDQTSYFWEVVSLEGILPKDDHYDIAITSDADADLQVTDVILAPGKTRHEWTQANGEVMNSSVAMTDEGITVRSSIYQNNYTKIDALGFEVHKQEAGGERIFGFNDDETNVSKLKADQQISMAPMRIVPVDFGAYSGWAFTPSKENN